MVVSMDQAAEVTEFLDELNQSGFVANCWFDPDKVLHVVIRSRKTLEDPIRLREFWRLFFHNEIDEIEES